MASVFLSYDRDDSDKARTIALALDKAGHSVWWDLHVRGGAQFSKVIEEALKAADAVVVLWSRESVESAWVRDEAAAGRDSGRLVPVTIDGTEAPLGFRQFQTIDLRDWKRGARGRGYKELEQAIAEKVTEPGPAQGETRHPVQSSAKPIDRKYARRRWLAALALMLAVLAGGLAAWRFSGRTSSEPVIAVTAADQSSSSQALARDLLAKLGSLQAARTDALELVGAAGSDPSRATFVFQGSASGGAAAPGGNLVLLSGRDRALLWSKDFETSKNQAAFEQSMAYTAGQVLDCALQANTSSEARLDEQTLKLFLNGCALFGDRYRADPASVVPIFSEVVAAAPDFQPAWSKLLLAEAQQIRGQMLFYDRLTPGNLPQHIRDARKLNPRLPELYVAEAALLPAGELDQRYQLAEKAVSLGPDNPDVLVTHAEFLSFIGRNSDAVDEARRAAELNPLSPAYRSNLIQMLTYSDQLPAAEEELRRAEQLWPGSPTIDDARFRLHSRYGDARDALRMVQSPDFRQTYPTQDIKAYLLARINPTETNVESAIAAVRSSQLTEGRKIGQLVQLLTDFGRDGEVYKMLLDLRPDQLRTMSPVFYRPNFREFRKDPRFMQLAVRAGLVDFWRKTREWPDFCNEPGLPYDCKKGAAKLAA
jgi:tetratricopeptide (TPR) repeat protein